MRQSVFVCVIVSKISQKVNRFQRNFQEMLIKGREIDDYILVTFQRDRDL